MELLVGVWAHLLTDVPLEFQLFPECLHLVLHVHPPQDFRAQLVFGIRQNALYLDTQESPQTHNSKKHMQLTFQPKNLKLWIFLKFGPGNICMNFVPF